MPQGWLITNDAAERLGVSASTVNRLRAAGKLEGESRGRGHIYTEASVTAAAERRGRWISQATAGELIGTAPHTLARAVARGELHPRDVDHALPSLARQEVLAWAERRRRRKEERDATRRKRAALSSPPDDGRVWLDVETTALVLRISSGRVRQLARADRLPHTRRGRRIWFVREHVEQVAAARALSVQRGLSA